MNQQSDNEIFVVEVIIPFTGHTHYKIVIAEDKGEAEELVRDIFRGNPLGDVSGHISLVSKKIDRSKKGIVEMDDQ